jgi:hypothetical protein
MTQQSSSAGNPNPVGIPIGDAGYDEAQQTSDQGVPVGQADVDADVQQGSGDAADGGDRSDEDYLEEVRGQSQSEDGVAVGSADVEEDRRAGQ